MSSGSSTSNTTTNQINQIPEWMSDAGQQNYAYAQQVAQQPLQQYQGQMVADTSPQTQQAWNVAANSGNVGSDQYNAATAGYLNAIGQSPMMNTAAQSALAAPMTAATGGRAAQSALANPVNAAQANTSQLAGTNLSSYMNPYTSSVINSTIPIMQQANALQQNQIQNQANSANAFGGSRQGIQQGVAQAQGAQNIGQMAAQLNQANFAQAQQAGESDVNQANQQAAANANQANQVGVQNMQAANNMGQWNAGAQNNMAQFGATAQNTAALNNMNAANNMGQFNATAQNQVAAANQQAQQAGLNSNILASQGLTNTGDSMSRNNVANFNMLQSAGAGQSMQAQNDINAQMAKFNQAFNYPQQQLGTLLSSLGMTPHDTSTSGQSNTTTTTPTDWANLIAKGAQTAGSLFPASSDKSMKTDITKLGKDPKTGLDMHAFRYKGDPKTYPKVVGPMAQEVQEKYPDKAKRIGGKLTVDPSIMTAAGVKGYAGGSPFVGRPSLAAFTPPSSPGVAKGIGALSAFKPQVRLPRGVGVAKVQRFDEGTADVQPMDPGRAKIAKGLKDIGDIWGSDDSAPGATPSSAAPSEAPQKTTGWGAPSMGYFQTGYAGGTPYVPPLPSRMGPGDDLPTPMQPGYAEGDHIPGRQGVLADQSNMAQPPTPPWNMVPQDAKNMSMRQKGRPPVYNNGVWPPVSLANGMAAIPGQGRGDTVPAMLTPGEAVLTTGAAQQLGRGRIAAMNAAAGPSWGGATVAPRAGARGIAGALANTKVRPKVMGGLSG